LSGIVVYYQGEAVQLLADGKAPVIPQPDEGATYEPIMKKELAQVDCYFFYIISSPSEEQQRHSG